MVKISILYPNKPDRRFDWQYYEHTHMPRSIELLSQHTGYLGVSVERGMGGAIPGTEATFVAICHFTFRSLEAFLEAFRPHAVELQGDMSAYTDVEPIIQVNEVVISH